MKTFPNILPGGRGSVRAVCLLLLFLWEAPLAPNLRAAPTNLPSAVSSSITVLNSNGTVLRTNLTVFPGGLSSPEITGLYVSNAAAQVQIGALFSTNAAFRSEWSSTNTWLGSQLSGLYVSNGNLYSQFTASNAALQVQIGALASTGSVNSVWSYLGGRTNAWDSKSEVLNFIGSTNLSVTVDGTNVTLAVTGPGYVPANNGTATNLTLAGTVTAADATSTAPSALANVTTLDRRYGSVVARFASETWRAYNGNGAGPTIPSITFVANLCDPWGRDGNVRVWTKTGNWTDMCMPIPSTWPVSGSVVIRSAWLPLLGDVCFSNIVVSHGWLAMTTNSPLIRSATASLTTRSATNMVLAGAGVTNVGWWVVSTNALPSAAYWQQGRSIAISRVVGHANDTYPTNAYFIYAEAELIR